MAPMSAFDPARYPKAERFLILAATYGEGDAPASARGFLDRLARMAPTAPLAVLGFGDRSFPAFCAYAAEVEAAARAKGWATLLPLDTVDRQSPQDFARWGRALGAGHRDRRSNSTTSPSARDAETLTLSRAATTGPRCRPRPRSCALPCRRRRSGRD